jgi:hypothetical protein
MLHAPQHILEWTLTLRKEESFDVMDNAAVK